MKGIQNIGNSCYLNSALQLLFNSYDFYQLLNMSNNVELKQNIINYHSIETNIFNPKNIKLLIDNMTSQFLGMSQQDSSEFIIYLFDIIDKTQHNILYDMFSIQTKINIKCKLINCLHETERIENELLLYLPITSDLSDSYREYKMVEKLENNYKCDKCMTKIISRKKIETYKWPNNLIIVLRRFDSMMKKNNDMINIPFNWRHGYVLNGGIVHIGNYGGGHYIYYGYNKDIGKWFIANDDTISIITDIDKFLKNIFFQFYIIYYFKFK